LLGVDVLMSCVLQDDLKKFVSEPQPPPHGIEIPKKGRPKTKSDEKSAKAMTPSSWRIPPTTMTMRRHCRTAFSCGRGLAVQAYLMCLLSKTRRLAWRLAWLRRRGSRATPPASG
jgi:hypothetical protein